MRQLLAAATALLLLTAVAMHLIGNDLSAEFFGDLAFFILLAAVVVPGPKSQTPPG